MKPLFIFFGTSRFSVIVLDELKNTGLLPEIIVTAPDRPKGRGLVPTPGEVKLWAIDNNIPLLQPEILDVAFIQKLSIQKSQMFVVASYGKIIPKEVLNLAENGAFNVHPSLLPKYRGASPLQSTILADDSETGVTLILMDEQMDHGPIVAQKKVPLETWPPNVLDLETVLAKEGGLLLAHSLKNEYPNIKAVPQNHGEATYTRKIKKEDGELVLDQKNARKNFLKFKAYTGWPGTYFFANQNEKKIRVLVKDARFENGNFILVRVLPEGKKEMSYQEFIDSLPSQKN